MQFNLISKSPVAINEATSIYSSEVQTSLFLLVLEELAAAKRLELVGEENVPTGEDESPDELETLGKVVVIAETSVGECPEDRTEEEHESMIEVLVEDLNMRLNDIVHGFLGNEDNSDQLNVIADIDWTTPKDLNWTTSENGGFIFIIGE